MNELLVVTTPVLIIIIGWFANRTLKSIDAKIDSTLREVQLTNGGLRELKVWATMHESIDDERFKRTEDTHKELREKINDLK